MWADFKFPPINLHNVWQSKYMRELEGDGMSALDKQVDGDLNRLINAVETDKPELFHGDMREGLLEALKEFAQLKETVQDIQLLIKENT